MVKRVQKATEKRTNVHFTRNRATKWRGQSWGFHPRSQETPTLASLSFRHATHNDICAFDTKSTPSSSVRHRPRRNTQYILCYHCCCHYKVEKCKFFALITACLWTKHNTNNNRAVSQRQTCLSLPKGNLPTKQCNEGPQVAGISSRCNRKASFKFWSYLAHRNLAKSKRHVPFQPIGATEAKCVTALTECTKARA